MLRMRGPIAGFGLVNKDFVACVPFWERDQKTEATAFWEQVGGPVPVALAAITRLGTEEHVVFLGTLGDDRDGDDLLRWLTEDGVDVALAARAPGVATSRSLVLLDERDGARTVVQVGEIGNSLDRTHR